MYSLILFIGAVLAWYIGAQEAKKVSPTSSKDIGEAQWKWITSNPYRAIAVFLWIGAIISIYNGH